MLVESLWPVIGHVFMIPLADKYMTDNRSQRFKKHTNTWPITGHNDSTRRKIHDRSQATTIQQAHKYMACDQWCISVLVESLLPVIGHVLICLLNRCGLWLVMYLCACWIVVACDRSCIWVLVESLLPLIMPLADKYMTDNRSQRFKKHTNTWPITGHKDSISRQIHDR
jgi:hypothetical protein